MLPAAVLDENKQVADIRNEDGPNRATTLFIADLTATRGAPKMNFGRTTDGSRFLFHHFRAPAW
jgi:hypothetical protein